MSHEGNDELKEKELEEEEEKSFWVTVSVNKDIEVFGDETKEQAENWVRNNLSDLLDYDDFEITGVINE
jgi:hypothetical protein